MHDGVIREDADGNAFAGYLTANDAEDPATELTYQLAETSSGPFVIRGNSIYLKEGAHLDFDEHPTYDLAVRVTDSHGGSTTEMVTIRVLDVSDEEQPPIDIVLTHSSIAENASNGSQIGAFTIIDPDQGDAFHLELVGSADGRFALFDGRLTVADGSRLDYEQDPAHTIRLRLTDASRHSMEKEFTISLLDADENTPPPPPPPPPPPENSAPTMMMLDGVQVVENVSNGTRIGQLRAHDPDNDAMTFSLLDNSDGRFAIVDDYVVVNDRTKLDYEQATTHQITVRVTDDHNNHRDAVFTIHVRNDLRDDDP
ncbi:cadherin domain-containing protein, partial [Streptomyces albidoflavus]|uniref:cadherin domain-containing protein n=1 Tax=Streptomyces albidoflavus TaxID=1886 RepID=UPI003435F622